MDAHWAKCAFSDQYKLYTGQKTESQYAETAPILNGVSWIYHEILEIESDDEGKGARVRVKMPL